MIVFGYVEALPTCSSAYPLACESCGVRVQVVAPADLRTLAALVRAFEDAHAECSSGCGTADGGGTGKEG